MTRASLMKLFSDDCHWPLGMISQHKLPDGTKPLLEPVLTDPWRRVASLVPNELNSFWYREALFYACFIGLYHWPYCFITEGFVGHLYFNDIIWIYVIRSHQYCGLVNNQIFQIPGRIHFAKMNHHWLNEINFVKCHYCVEQRFMRKFFVSREVIITCFTIFPLILLSTMQIHSQY